MNTEEDQDRVNRNTTATTILTIHASQLDAERELGVDYTTKTEFASNKDWATSAKPAALIMEDDQ